MIVYKLKKAVRVKSRYSKELNKILLRNYEYCLKEKIYLIL